MITLANRAAGTPRLEPISTLLHKAPAFGIFCQLGGPSRMKFTNTLATRWAQPITPCRRGRRLDADGSLDDRNSAISRGVVLDQQHQRVPLRCRAEYPRPNPDHASPVVETNLAAAHARRAGPVSKKLGCVGQRIQVFLTVEVRRVVCPGSWPAPPQHSGSQSAVRPVLAREIGGGRPAAIESSFPMRLTLIRKN